MKLKIVLTLLVTSLVIAAAISVAGFDPDVPVIYVTPGASKVLVIEDIKRVAIGDQNAVDVAVISENELLVVATGSPGARTSLHVWAGDDPYPHLSTIHVVSPEDMFIIDAKKIDGVYDIALEPGGNGNVMVRGFVRDEQARQKVMNLAGVWVDSIITDGLLLPGDQPPLTEEMLQGVLTISDSQVVTKLFSPRSRSASDLNTLLTSMLSADGRIIVDATTNTMIVIDLPENVETIGRFIERLDEQSQHQVMIEAKFIELSEAATEQLGVNWGLSTASSRGATAVGVTNPLVADRSLNGGITMAFNAATGNFKDLAITNLTATVNAMEKDGKLNILSSPRVTTVNGARATVNITNSRSYVAGYDFIYDDAGNITSATPDLATVETGIDLDVTPVIGRDDIVTLAITPTVRELTEMATGGTADYPIGLPVVDERTTTVTVKLMDGGTLIIAGLMRNRTDQASDRIPLLGRIPLIGRLFRSESTDETKQNLSIFITAHIIKYIDMEDAEADAE